MHQKNTRPDDLDLGSTTSLSSSMGYQNGTVNCATNDNFNLDLMEQRAIRGSNRGNFDEIDLVSECSTPIVYTPGKYLQLCDISPSAEVSDVTLWPSSLGAPPAEWDTAALVLPQKKPFEDNSFKHSYKQHSSSSSSHYHRHYRQIRCLPHKYLVIIAVCLIIALSALGSLVVLI